MIELMILIIEDDTDIRELLGMALLKNKFEVISAHNGREGIEQYKKHKIDIEAVILDMTLPDITGASVFQELISISPSLKILITTGLSDDRITNNIVKKSVGILKKPFSIPNFVQDLREILQK